MPFLSDNLFQLLPVGILTEHLRGTPSAEWLQNEDVRLRPESIASVSLLPTLFASGDFLMKIPGVSLPCQSRSLCVDL
ncbi:hypothetical protein BDZ97DRAFT_1407442 [Flammula alnicola]|nr:hypothetical protein BDZ97DRAFT_1407442 [Flammula alnicola]